MITYIQCIFNDTKEEIVSLDLMFLSGDSSRIKSSVASMNSQNVTVHIPIIRTAEPIYMWILVS